MKKNESIVEIIEDNGGFIHIAELQNGRCVYYLSGQKTPEILSALNAALAGAIPTAEGWEGSEEDPQSCYEEVTALVNQHNCGAWEVSKAA